MYIEENKKEIKTVPVMKFLFIYLFISFWGSERMSCPLKEKLKFKVSDRELNSLLIFEDFGSMGTIIGERGWEVYRY